MKRKIGVFAVLFSMLIVFGTGTVGAAVVTKSFKDDPSAASSSSASSAHLTISNTGIEVDFQVNFVDKKEYTRKIFLSQNGAVPDGTSVSISFPEQIVGKDGYIWKAVVESPQTVVVEQAGNHKYYIEFERGKKVLEPERPDEENERKLKEWKQKAWEADCEITRQAVSDTPDPYLVVENLEQNNNRIKNLVSMIDDIEWHYFYMIGKNYTPQSLIIGTAFDAEYSTVTMDSFSIKDTPYVVVRIGIKRNWNPETCGHTWAFMSSVSNGCLESGKETYQCHKCGQEETILLPALGHKDDNRDSLCDHCEKRAFAQSKGDQIETVLKTSGGELNLSFTCLDDNYQGSGKMLYLADKVLDSKVTGVCFIDDNQYNTSALRSYFSLGFDNDLSIGSALQTIRREEPDEIFDEAVLLSKEEYERYQLEGMIPQTNQGWFLRSPSGNGKIGAVQPDGTYASVTAAGNTNYGARPFILLDKPVTNEKAEPYHWKEGDVQARKVGGKTYLFRCVDEDYSDNQDSHRKAALFLCDTVIRSDIDSDSFNIKKFSFGSDNNYKTSEIRAWLQHNASDSLFNLEPIYIGVNTAFTGSTKSGNYEQLEAGRLISHEIGFQLMKDELFCLSIEEALKYRNILWKFSGAIENNPETQLSAYSEGYYLRTPFYAVDGGSFKYTDDIYIVDLENGSIHTIKTGSTSIGLRPAFSLPQE